MWDCLDVFGASGRVMRTWVDAGYEATNFDIKVSRSHDLCGESGVKALLTRGLEPLEQEIKVLHCFMMCFCFLF